jgi:hypothetical protein
MKKRLGGSSRGARNGDLDPRRLFRPSALVVHRFRQHFAEPVFNAILIFTASAGVSCRYDPQCDAAETAVLSDVDKRGSDAMSGHVPAAGQAR